MHQKVFHEDCHLPSCCGSAGICHSTCLEMPRIAKVRTYFWKKKLSGGGPPDDPRPRFRIQLFLFLWPPPHFSAPSYATDIFKYLQIWMIPHIITLFEFISVPHENQHQTLNIKKIDRGQIRLREYLLRGPGIDSRSHHYDLRDWLSPASKSQFGWNITKAT